MFPVGGERIMQIVSPELIGRKIKEERQRQRLTQDGLGELIYMNGSRVCRMEKGEAIEHLQTLVLVADALHIDVRALVEAGIID